MDKSIEKPRNVLVTRFSALGDVAMTVPVMYSVCRSNPETNFVFVTKKAMQSLFVNAPQNLTVVGVDLKTDYKGTRGLWQMFKDLREKYDIDAVADLHGVLRTYAIGIMARLKGVRYCSIRKGRKGKRALTRKHNKVMLPLLSSRARYREVFFRLGLAVEYNFRSLYGDKEAPYDTFAYITAAKQPGEKWIGVAPFARHSGKIYPTELMQQVVGQLASRSGVKIFLFGAGDRERDILAGWANQHKNVISLADRRHGFPTELALMSHLDVMLTMDSGNMHLASLVGVRVVSIWGATHPYCGFKGFRQLDTDIIQLPMPCRPCSVFGNKPCSRGDYYCLRGIPPKMVVEKVLTNDRPKRI
ncbi:MAG: glycosyltransferase family 9 protein [Muribaculum sp.]|nr:glycosyltransferase family 9 protein [Muribaculaceae bacterium]MCM1081194.1 glycosyltransferase family 9 protein [Muribaculum sp.]